MRVSLFQTDTIMQEDTNLSLTGSVFESSNPFMSQNKFSEEIEKVVLRESINYFEAILVYCDEHSVDPEDVKPFISSGLRQKVEADAIELGLLPKRSTLEFI